MGTQHMAYINILLVGLVHKVTHGDEEVLEQRNDPCGINWGKGDEQSSTTTKEVSHFIISMQILTIELMAS